MLKSNSKSKLKCAIILDDSSTDDAEHSSQNGSSLKQTYKSVQDELNAFVR